MMFVPVVAITAFIVILADLNWKWVDSNETIPFVHSIIGIITIGFSMIQVKRDILSSNGFKKFQIFFSVLRFS